MTGGGFHNILPSFVHGGFPLTARALILVCAIVFTALWVGPRGAIHGAQRPVESASSSHAVVLDTYCVTCHSDKARTGGLSLERADLADIPKGAETWEKVIRKVRAGMMPPVGMPRPDKQGIDAFAGYFETSLERAAAAKPNPGRVAMHRLNRAEYANA